MGFMSANMLVEELRIAYRGWELVEEELEKKAVRSRPNIGNVCNLNIAAPVILLFIILLVYSIS